MSDKQSPVPVRYMLDFRIIPHLFYSNPAPFLNAMAEKKEALFANIFNDYYKPANESFLSETPVIFAESDFNVQAFALSRTRIVYAVELPGEHDVSMVWCRAYMFAYDINEDGSDARVQFFTVEESSSNTVALCSVYQDGKRSNYGPCGNDSLEVCANKVAAIMFR